MVHYYECIICNYKTKDSGNLSHHNKTKKHLRKMEQIKQLESIATISHSDTTVIPPNLTQKKTHLCKYCKSSFSRADSLTRHKRRCVDKHDEDNKLKKQLEEYNHKFEVLNCKLNKFENDSKHFEENAKYYKQMLMEAGGLVKKSVSALTYSITNYDNAPCLQSIQIDEIKSFDNSTKNIVDDILSYYKHKTLSEHLGKIILAIYKKENPLDQSIWNTDDSRLTYIVKELMNNKTSNWIVDKKGTKTATYLIEPLLAHVKKLIISYQENFIVPNSGFNVTEMEMVLENSKKIIEIVNDIDDNIIAKDILKYISVHLRFNNNSLKE